MSEQNTQREAAVQQQQAVAQSRNLNAELQILAKFGGFNVLESSVDGIQNMNPERKARRNIFLSDPERVAERKELEKTYRGCLRKNSTKKRKPNGSGSPQRTQSTQRI